MIFDTLLWGILVPIGTYYMIRDSSVRRPCTQPTEPTHRPHHPAPPALGPSPEVATAAAARRPDACARRQQQKLRLPPSGTCQLRPCSHLHAHRPQIQREKENGRDTKFFG